MHIPLKHKVGNKIIKVKALLDSGAGGRFVSSAFTQTLGKKWDTLPEWIKVFNMDGTLNKTAWISHTVNLVFMIEGKEFHKNFLILEIGKESIILGLPWLRSHNSKIDWQMGEIKFPPQQKITIRKFTGVLDITELEVLIRAKTTTSQELAQAKKAPKKVIEELVLLYLAEYYK
ncbi:pro-pol protein [Moniliophthora roreri MCA 2997]|uniref:Pro-pol protein n=1 Tax=Moniliophthora roreri (strain MCA 2997) TaxID=1381753 RepID=V2XAK3_MONRO|nr:pro-pol protein [Moniliophthora roreri MCA 2997]